MGEGPTVTRTHNGHCGNAKITAWTECSCVCEGTQHPRGEPFLVPRDRDRRRDYATALRDAQTAEGELIRQAFLLVRHALEDPAEQRALTTRLCAAVRTQYYLGRPPLHGQDLDGDDIRDRQETSRRLLERARELESGEALDAQVAHDLFGGQEPSVDLLYFCAVLHCGYLGDFSDGDELVELVEPTLRRLLPRVLVMFVTGRSADDEAQLVRLLESSAALGSITSDLHAIIESQKATVVAQAGLTSEEATHFACSLLVQMAEALMVPGAVVDFAVDAVVEAVRSLLPDSWPDPAKVAALLIVRKIVERVLESAVGDELSVEAALAFVRLCAVVMCPAIEDHPEVQQCLGALTTQTLIDQLSDEAKTELAAMLPTA